ncbi:MAG: LamG-like jellyroll fold domain-containing protein, partial [Nanoarchaeota archaeon]
MSAQEINESFSKSRQYFSNEIFLNNSNFNKWDSFKLGYKPGDGFELGDEVNSSILTVNNSQPSEPTVTDFGRAGVDGIAESVAANRASSARPLNATFMTAINITWNSAADNDSDTINYTVLINNTRVCDTTRLSCNTTQLPSWNGNAAFYIFNVTAFDQEWNSTTTTYAFNFDNTTPTMSIIASTPANNTFQNTTSYFINLSVTETSIDRLILNITGPSFAGTGGDGPSSSGQNLTLWDKDLTLMLHFEESNGSAMANDSSGFRHDGTVTNVNSSNDSIISGFNASGRLGRGFVFDQRNDFVNSSRSSLLEPGSGDFTAMAWVRRQVVGVGTFILYKGPSTTYNCAAGNEHWALIFRGDDDRLESTICNYGGNYVGGGPTIQADTVSGNYVIPAGVWSHVAAVYKQSISPDNVTFYINGTAQA